MEGSLKDFIKYFKEFNKEDLIDLLWYLKENKYDEDIKLLFLETFKAMRDGYYIHKPYELNLSEPERFAKSLIEKLKKAPKIEFVDDINKEDLFYNSVKPIENINISVGYVKDENGHYSPSNVNPTHFCLYAGWTAPTKDVLILYDDTTKYSSFRLYDTLVHETTHTAEDGFQLYSYILNKYYIKKILREGYAMKESRRVRPNGCDLSDVPFKYNTQTHQFEFVKYIEYPLYRYLYFKLEVLLGSDFMNKWSADVNSNHYLSLACKEINSAYGDGTFEKLYEYMQLILFALQQYNSNMKLVDDELVDKIVLYNKVKTQSKESIKNEYNNVSLILNNDQLLQESYLKQLQYIIDTKKYIDEFRDEEEKDSDLFDEDDYSELQHFNKLTHELADLKKQMEAIEDLSFFEKTLSIEKKAYKFSIQNSDFLTHAAIKLEALILNCIQNGKKNKKYTKQQLLDYYNYNVADDKAYQEIIKPMLEKNIDVIKIKKAATK
jgi:hypothetical protein